MSGFNMMLSAAASALGIEYNGNDCQLTGVSTDTRQIKSGELFIALRGPNFDGHQFIEKAIANGAAAVITDHETNFIIPCLVVKDTRIALGKLASAWRQQFTIPLVAVTGSNGKTTVKEMLASIFSQQGHTLSTQGNFNNDIGVPLTLFRLDKTHTAAVIEMGANHAAEIEYLTMLAHPTVAVVNNAAEAHLEGFGSLLGVATSKGEIYSGLGPDGVAVINTDDKFAYVWEELCEGKSVISFGLNSDADVTARYEMTGTGMKLHIRAGEQSDEVLLPLLGRHNVMNALAATSVALGAGLSLDVIIKGLACIESVPGRQQLLTGLNGSRIINDTYNANPSSLRAGVSVLVEFPGKRYLALGDMGELGNDATQMHKEAGLDARQQGVDRLYAVGELAQHACQGFAEGAQWYEQQEELIEALQQELDQDVTLLVKGSRRMHMERVVEAVTARVES